MYNLELLQYFAYNANILLKFVDVTTSFSIVEILLFFVNTLLNYTCIISVFCI